MRLTEAQQAAVVGAIRARDPDARVYLFGSRLNDKARGGDIDLLVISDRIAFEDEWGIRRDILDRIGWQKLDLIVRRSDARDAIAEHALETGVQL